MFEALIPIGFFIALIIALILILEGPDWREAVGYVDEAHVLDSKGQEIKPKKR